MAVASLVIAPCPVRAARWTAVIGTAAIAPPVRV
jgi:hypothetical protein